MSQSLLENCVWNTRRVHWTSVLDITPLHSALFSSTGSLTASDHFAPPSALILSGNQSYLFLESCLLYFPLFNRPEEFDSREKSLLLSYSLDPSNVDIVAVYPSSIPFSASESVSDVSVSASSLLSTV